jgi:predicted flap endonuclease-1-like 5' DNA nuclease
MVVLSDIWPCLLVAFGLGAVVAWLLNDDLSRLVTKDELPDFAVFARRTELPALPDFGAFARRSELPTRDAFLPASVLKTLALKTELPQVPDLTGYAKLSDIPPMPDLSDYARRKDLPDTRRFLTAVDLAPLALRSELRTPDLGEYARKSDIPELPDFSRFALKADIPTLPDLSALARKADIPPPPDLSGYALKSEIPPPPDLSGVARARDVQSALEERDRAIALLTDGLRSEESSRTAEIARLDRRLDDAMSPSALLPPAATSKQHPDNLELIHGIGPVLADRLHRLGVDSFAQIARWTEGEIGRIEAELHTLHGRIDREGWVDHARRLHHDTHGEWLGPPPATPDNADDPAES